MNDISAAQFVTINVDGTVTSNDTVDVGGGLMACVCGSAGVMFFANTVYHSNFDHF